MDVEKAKERYFDQGYFVAGDAVEPRMLEELQAAAGRVWAKVRSGEVDVAGNGPDATAIFGLIAPEFGEPVFARYLVSEPVLRYVSAFLGDELRLGHVHLWCADSGYDTGWHRDVGKERDVSREREMEILTRPMRSIKWQLALLDDPCLWVVPGSHKRYRTEAERNALVVDTRLSISGEVQVKLKRGECIFWNGHLIHRGRQPRDLPRRLTLTGGLRMYRPDESPEELDGRFAWRLAGNIREALPEKMQLFYDRWRALQKAG